MLQIRQYQESDNQGLIKLVRILQNHIAEIDPIHINKSGDSFDAEGYVDRILYRLNKEKGEIFIAEETDIIGFIAGIVQKTGKEEEIEILPTTDGRIIELIVAPDQRGKNVGKALMDRMEKYFKENECDFSRVECFAPNTGAHGFYEKCGYVDRSIEMIKKSQLG
ncbi:GNAT family N-acetyltransferase [Patescibacteria group bacterium]|nr:GNAT family N-acetyltransferase [Patescibacteria group bacterium]